MQRQRRHQRYELRLGASTVRTGYLAEISEFHIGDRLEVEGSAAVVRAVEHHHDEVEPKLILELLPRSA